MLSTITQCGRVSQHLVQAAVGEGGVAGVAPTKRSVAAAAVAAHSVSEWVSGLCELAAAAAAALKSGSGSGSLLSKCVEGDAVHTVARLSGQSVCVHCHMTGDGSNLTLQLGENVDAPQP
jgi:hypothetical protein